MSLFFKRHRSSTTFYCFSPPVMLATFAIEILLVIYSFFRYRLETTLSRLAVTTLVLLAVFQLAEYFTCAKLDFGFDTLVWSRIGYIAITLLPPLGLHLIQTVAKKKNPILVYGAYLLSFLFILFFAFTPSSINSAICAGNYAIFRLYPSANILYGIYYNFLLFLSIFLTLDYKKVSKSIRIKNTLTWIFIGYMLFYLPTALISVADPLTLVGVPSIMCGFAVLYALVLTFRIIPLSMSEK